MLDFEKICEVLDLKVGCEASQIKYNTIKSELEERWKVSKKGNRYYTDKEGTLYVITEIKGHNDRYRCSVLVKDKNGNSNFELVDSPMSGELFSDFHIYALQFELFGIGRSIEGKKYKNFHELGSELISNAIQNQTHETGKMLIELQMHTIECADNLVHITDLDFLKPQTAEQLLYHRVRRLRSWEGFKGKYSADTLTVFTLCTLSDDISTQLKLNNQDEENKRTLEGWLSVYEGYLKLV